MVKYSFLRPNPIFLTPKQVFYSLVAALFSGQEFVDKFYAIFNLEKCEKF